jgi:CRISPR system Cascade subunit CasD
MSVLLLRLSGPMQSWGTQSRFAIRDTGREPSKSGVIGILCAALGRPRDQGLDDLTGLTMGVRVDQEGRLARDYQTAGGEQRTGQMLGTDSKGQPIPYGVIKADGSKPGTVQSWRYYLADASFLVALSGDHDQLETLDAALARPHWPLSLGRKSYVPGEPVRLPDGLRDEDDIKSAFANYPWQPPRREPPDYLRLTLETNDPTAGPPRNDVPLSFKDRRFTVRYVQTDWLPTADLPQPVHT